MDIKIDHAIADHKYNNLDISAWADIDEEFITQKIGVQNRYFLDRAETTSELALKACKKLFCKCNLKGTDPGIDALVLVTQNPDYAIPHTSAIVQGKLALPDTVACFDISLGCSGYVYALSACKALINSEKYNRVLLVTCDPYSKIMKRSDRETISIFSDAAAATLLTNNEDGNVNIGFSDMGTCGKKYDYLILKKSGLHSDFGGIWNENEEYRITDESFVKMNGRGIYNFVISSVPKSINRCLSKNALKLSDIDFFCFHQASKFILESLQEVLGFKKDQLLTNLSDIGNTVSSSIPILLEEGIDSNIFSGKKVLICGFGVGLSWACNVLYFK